MNQDQKKILVIFGATQVDISQSLDQIRACIEGGYDVFVILSDVAGKIFQIDEIRDICGTDRVIIDSDLVDLNFFIDGFGLTVIALLSQTISSKLILGIADTPSVFLPLQALARGDRVVGVSTQLEEKTSRLIKFRSVHHQLLDLGIELVRTDQIADLIMSDGSRAFFTESLNNKKTVITASSIERLPLTVSELVCPVNSLVTPLAKEVAARKKVNLID
ncbi:hypothetical protein CMK22_04415 [Candidatus Poribacteria bacterium]|nr:hypothetical protein [Candidatus Poribacteria bacterium]